jgi:hypothetical protein
MRKTVPFATHAFAIVAAILAASSCGAVKRSATAMTRDTATVASDYRANTLTDRETVYIHDSTVVRETKDTLVIERQRLVNVFRDRLRTDTVIRTDTVRAVQTVSETIRIENATTLWQKLQIWTGRILTAMAVLIAVYFMIKSGLKR